MPQNLKHLYGFKNQVTEQLPEYQVEELTLDINEIQTDPTNPNKMSEQQIGGLMESINRFENLEDILVDENNTIIDGYHRYTANKRLGKKEINVKKIVGLTAVQKKQLRQIMNKLRGQHDKTLDIAEYKTMFEMDSRSLLDLANTLAISPEDIIKQVQNSDPDWNTVAVESFIAEQGLVMNQDELDKEERDKVREEKVYKPIDHGVTLGSLWKLGEHYLYCGDSGNPDEVMSLFNDKLKTKVDLMVTDPPYFVDYASKNAYLNNMDKSNRNTRPIENDEGKDPVEFFTSFLQAIPWNEYSIYYIFIGTSHMHDMFEALKKTEYYMSQVLIWVKNSMVFGRQDYHYKHENVVYGWKDKHKFYGLNNCTTVLEFARPSTSSMHPTMKPVELLRKLIMDGSEKNALVYDPFGGSGSTLIACEQTSRRCVMIEIDPHYCNTIIDRFQSLNPSQDVTQVM